MDFPSGILTNPVTVDQVNATVYIHVVFVGAAPVVESSSTTLQDYFSDPILPSSTGDSQVIHVPIVGQDGITASTSGWYYVFEVRDPSTKTTKYKYLRPERTSARLLPLAALPEVSFKTVLAEASPTQLRLSDDMIQWLSPDGDWRPLMPVSDLKGATGPIGPRGPIGETGYTGPAGESGADGPRGFTGAQGLMGPAGIKGEPGDPGIQGPRGIDGAPGEQGPTGPKGDRGGMGFQGLDGPRGLTGPKGDTGDVGPQGSTGATGSQGPKGDTGARGEQGIPGTKGDSGAVGAKGDQGIQGVQGPKGDQGVQGVKGDTGTFSGTSTSDIEFTATNTGIIIKSPNGTRWRLHVTDAGATMWEALS